MENYFHYFTEIEEHFQRRRGAALLLSTLDWALIETWKQQGVPLAAVLRGIDAAFDSFARRPRRGRKINSLAYCTQAVLEAADQLSEASLGAAAPAAATAPASAPSTAPSTKDVAGYLLRNASLLAAASLPVAVEIAATLRSLAAAFAPAAADAQNPAAPVAPSPPAATSPPLVTLEELERRLTVLEEKLFAALVASTPEAELLSLRAQAEREMAPFRREMRGPQLQQLHRQFLQKRLLERHHLPRLSLFYMF